jgi:hypothetical protein
MTTHLRLNGRVVHEFASPHLFGWTLAFEAEAAAAVDCFTISTNKACSRVSNGTLSSTWPVIATKLPCAHHQRTSRTVPQKKADYNLAHGDDLLFGVLLSRQTCNRCHTRPNFGDDWSTNEQCLQRLCRGDAFGGGLRELTGGSETVLLRSVRIALDSYIQPSQHCLIGLQTRSR